MSKRAVASRHPEWDREQELKRLDEARALDEKRRIERQRTLFAMLTDNRATDMLKQAMLQRAYDLMCQGQGEAADAIGEFMPSRDAEAMFDAWFDDQDDKLPKSKWY